MRRYTKLTQYLIVMFAILLSGCSIKEMVKPAKRYDLSQAFYKKATSFDVTTSKILKIEHIKSLDRLQSDKIWYQRSNFQTNSYIYSFWSDNFSSIIEKNLADSLYRSAIFRSVFQGHSKLKPDLLLESELVEAKQIVKDKVFVKFALRLYLVDAKSKKLLSSKEFSYKQSCPTIDAKGAIKAYNEIIKKLDKDVVLWIEQSIKKN